MPPTSWPTTLECNEAGRSLWKLRRRKRRDKGGTFPGSAVGSRTVPAASPGVEKLARAAKVAGPRDPARPTFIEGSVALPGGAPPSLLAKSAERR